jgi:hypothetical protein
MLIRGDMKEAYQEGKKEKVAQLRRIRWRRRRLEKEPEGSSGQHSCREEEKILDGVISLLPTSQVQEPPGLPEVGRSVWLYTPNLELATRQEPDKFVMVIPSM